MTDREILAIAARLWQQEQGMDFTMDRLVEATAISRATLYRRFGSREAILQRLVDEGAIAGHELTRPDMRTRIMQATRTALGRYGFSGITIEQIAQEAGVGPATIYRHFGSKEALIEAFVQATSPRRLLGTLVAGEKSDLEQDLILLATAMLEFIHENQALARVILFENEGGEAILAHVRATQGRTVTAIAAYLEAHIKLGNLPPRDPLEMALAFIGMFIGLAFVGPQAYARPIADMRATAQSVTHIFLHGVTQAQAHSQPQSQPTATLENQP